jgi:C4-dicarboxylate transporter/malic acid transport protein
MHTKEQKFIKEFTPNWFAVIMGNGGVALVLQHYASAWPFLWYIATTLWCLDIVLFILFTTFFITQFCYYPEHFKLMMKNATQPLFLGCIPMALTTIVSGFIAFGVPILGKTVAISLGITFWWIAVALALMIGWLLPFIMFLFQEHSLESMTPLWLLPVVACEVAAASGGLFIGYMNVSLQATVLMLCFVLWSISVSLAFAIITIFIKRLIIHSLPSQNLAPSIWLVLGPLGTGVLGLITLGHAAQQMAVDVSPHLKAMVDMLPGMDLFGAIILWGFALWWLGTALISTLYQFFKGINFAMSWWAFTFPLAVFTLGTLAIATETKMLLFEVIGIFSTLLLLFFWITVITKTSIGALNQSLFSAPCLKENQK